MSLATATNHLYTPTFLLLCSSYAFFGGSFNMIIPELPAYLSSLGGSELKGLIIALFTLTAGLSRPFSGKLADIVGRKPIIIFGTIVCIICSLLYPILSSVGGFLALRLIHGFSTGFSPTAITAYVADIVPVHRRGEAMGIIGVSINFGSSLSPPLGGYLANHYSLSAMFVASAALALISLSLLIRLHETIPVTSRFKARHLKLTKTEIINRRSVLPALVCGLSYLGYGAILTVTPDQCEFLGMSNKGLFFTTFTLCTVLSRLVAGTVSDRYGRLPVMRFAVVLLALAYVLFGQADSPNLLLMGSGFVGFSIGIVIPAVFAWTTDRSDDNNRGKSFATLFIGLEFAIGSGAILGATLYHNEPSQFKFTFLVMGLIAFVALFFIREDSFSSIWKKRFHSLVRS
ncbi:MAG: MFS transporter [Saprospiraceae bacterium]|nr:MFS transporter [Saprospiraceae bacterium]